MARVLTPRPGLTKVISSATRSRRLVKHSMRHAIFIEEQANVPISLIVGAIKFLEEVLAPEVFEAERPAAENVETGDLECLAELYGTGIVCKVDRRNAIASARRFPCRR